MKIKSTLKRGLSFIMSLTMVVTLLLNVGVLYPKAATATVEINGVELTVDIGVTGSAAYFKNGDTSSTGPTGTSTDWNAKYENMGSWIRLTFKNLNIDVNGNPAIYSEYNDVTLLLEGTNVINEVSDSNNATLIYVPNNKTFHIYGDGSLELNDPVCSTVYTIKCGKLQLADSASFTVNVGAYGSQQSIMNLTNGLSMEDNASLEIEAGAGGMNFYGIYSDGSASGIVMSDQSSLSINMEDGNAAATNSDLTGIYAPGGAVNLLTSGTVDISVGNNYNSTGLHVKSLTLDSGTLNVNVAQGASTTYGVRTQSGNVGVINGGKLNVKLSQNEGTVTGSLAKYGVFSSGGLTVEGASSVTVNTGESLCAGYGVYIQGLISMTDTAVLDIDLGTGKANTGIRTSTNVQMSGDASIDIDATGSDGVVTGIDGGSSSTSVFDMSENSNIDVNLADSEDGVRGIYLYGDDEITMSDNATLTVFCGEGDFSQAIYLSNEITMSGKSAISAIASDSTLSSRGVYLSYLSLSDDAKLTATAGTSTATQMGESYGLYLQQTGSVSDNATVVAEAGTSGTISEAIHNTGAFTVSGGTVEAIGATKAFSDGVVIDETSVSFEVKAGTSSTTATKQTATQIADDATYTGNSYVLIKAVQTIERVDLSDIDELVHGEVADTTVRTDTEGVETRISVSWAPIGDILGGTEYTGTITITPIDGYVFADDVEVYYGNEKLTASLQADGSVKATYKQTAQKTELVSVTAPSDITGVDNGTALADITLPAKVDITTGAGADKADVTWDLTSVNYDPDSEEEQTFTVSGTIVAPNYVYTSNVNLNVSIKVTVKAAATTATTEEPTTTSTEDTTTQAPATTSTEDVTTQAPGGSMTDTEAPTTATTATTTEAPDNSDANVKTGDSAPLNIMLVLMLLAGIGMVVVGKKKSE